MARKLSRRTKVTASVLILGFVVLTCVIALYSPHGLDTELINAVKSNDFVAVRSLLARGANANARDDSSRWFRMTAPILGEGRLTLPYPTALTVLVYQEFEPTERSMNIAKALLDHGARTEEHYRDGNTLLMHAVWEQKTKLVDLLLQRGANVNARNNYGATPLMHASASGVGTKDTSLIKKLVGLGADLNARDIGGRTPLRYAVEYGWAESAATLIGLKADPNIRDNQGVSPLAAARSHGIMAVVQVLKKAGALP